MKDRKNSETKDSETKTGMASALLKSGIVAPLLYLLLLLIWNLATYTTLIALQTKNWPLCWDFIHYYQCGAMAISPDRFHVYDAQMQLDWTNKLISPVHVKELWFIQFVPFVFPLMAPFALLPIKLSYVVWSVVSIILGLIALNSVSRRGFRSPAAVVGLSLAGLACFPAWMNTWWGQFAWFYVCLLGFYFISLNDKKQIKAGILLALLSIKPQYIPYLLLAPIVAKKWQLLAVSAVCEIALFTLAGFVIGWEQVIHYPLTLLSAEKQTGNMQVNAADMVSFRGPLSLILPENLVLIVSMMLTIAAFPLIWILWRKAFKAKQTNWAMAITILAMMVLSPHSHAYDCLFLMLAGALTFPTYKFTELFSGEIAEAGDLVGVPTSPTGHRVEFKAEELSDLESGRDLRAPGEHSRASGNAFESKRDFESGREASALGAETPSRRPQNFARIAYRIWMGGLFFYPLISWLLFFPLNDFDNKLYPKAYALLDMLIFLSGLAYFFNNHSDRK